MAVLLRYQPVDDMKAWVTLRHYQPEKLTQAHRDAGIMIESEADLPKAPEPQPGVDYRLMVDLNTKELFWEAAPRPKTQEELLAEVLDRMNDMVAKQTELVNLMKGQAEK